MCGGALEAGGEKDDPDDEDGKKEKASKKKYLVPLLVGITILCVVGLICTWCRSRVTGPSRNVLRKFRELNKLSSRVGF